jgi:phosphate transport system permease protein
MLRTPLSLTGRREGKITEAIFIWVARFAVFAPLAMLAWLLGKVVITGVDRIDWDFIKDLPSRRAGQAGIWPALMGSVWLIALTAIISLPIGIGAAVYLE